MAELSTKPYLIRAIYEWCADSGFTPYINVKVDQSTRVPVEYVKNGEIVLSISQQATRNLTIGNDVLQFSARFNGVSREIAVPIYAVQSIFARENGRGVFFDPESPPETTAAPASPSLQSVPAAPSEMHGDEEPVPDKPRGPPRGNLRVIK
ncbi:MAG: ClpXP protease specificity-enhancing factor [Betaproteobacteria bacterium]|nr:ClpXP protease specificity-enhancing factor [Betaproteobacteria bacterium]